jgi:hypothetical protein
MTAKWVGADDAEYVSIGGASIGTTSGTFRAGYADCALQGQSLGICQESFKEYTETAFWFSGRICNSTFSNTSGAAVFMQFLDSNLLPRLQIRGTATDYTYKVQTVDEDGVAVDIGNLIFMPVSGANGRGDKIDIYINYDVAGSIDIYVNLVHVFAFVGDCTTNGVTALARHRLGGQGGGSTWWSETWIDDEDTRSQSLPSWRPVANGNANTFPGSAASNVNEISLNVTTLNQSDTPGQIDQYTSGAVPTGILDVKDVIISAYAQRGTTGPSKLALGVRTNSSDFWGSDQALDIAWQNIQEVFPQNPDTVAEWLRTEIGTAAGYNFGAKSAA